MENRNSDNPTLDNAILEMQNYNINGHIHNYAVWTAARAVQRRFQGATTKSISNAINDAGLKAKFLDSDIKWTDDKFEKIHEEAIEILKSNLANCTYGRAAKIIAIYIKTAIVLPSKGENSLSKVAFPPIDNILLSNLKDKDIIESKPIWTQIKDSDAFFIIITQIKTFLKHEPLWKIECFWQSYKKIKK